MNPVIVLVYPNGGFVGMDANSGGYPYLTDDINQAKKWPINQIDKIDQYIEMFSKEHFEKRLLSFTLTSI